MRMPYWLLRLLPMWNYLCPKCRSKVKQKSHKCPYCGENYGKPLRVPPRVLKDKKALSDYVHKHIFPKVSQAHRDYLTQFFTVLFAHGFEGGDFGEDPETGDAWTGTNGSPAVDSNEVYDGSYSAEFNANGEYCYKGLGSTTVVYMRIYARFTTALTSDGARHQLFGMGANSPSYSNRAYLELYRTGSTNYWRLVYADSASNPAYLSSSVPTPTVDTWYCLEILWNRGTLVEFWIDGTSRGSSEDVYDSAVTGCQAGTRHITAGSQLLYVDCVVVADAYIGPEEEVTLKTVTDSLLLTDSVLSNKTFSVSDMIGLSDVILRNKTLVVTDSVGANDAVLGNKSPLIVADAVSLSELINVITEAMLKTVTDQVSLSDGAKVLKQLGVSDAVTLVDGVNVTERILRVLDAVALADTLHVNKFLQVTEAISLAEVVQVGVEGVKKTKLFLILGELAVQLTGD